MSSREQLALRFALSDGHLPANHIRGLASAYGTLIDAYIPTRILPGAFTKTLREDAHRVKVLNQHNPDWPIGIPTRMVDTREGLLVEAKISQTTMGQEVLTLIREKILTELSIGFDTTRHELVDEAGIGQVRHIKELRLWEFSPVTFAANKDARITSVNSAHQRGSRDLSRAIEEAERRHRAFQQWQLRDLEIEFLKASAGLR